MRLQQKGFPPWSETGPSVIRKLVTSQTLVGTASTCDSRGTALGNTSQLLLQLWQLQHPHHRILCPVPLAEAP